MSVLESLLNDIKQCSHCEKNLPLGANPVLQVNRKSKILIAGQAPGKKVHNSGIPFDDPSGNRLRDWMGISSSTFYDSSRITILPMGFCYPGSGKSGDLPPRPECELMWRQKLLDQLPNIKLTLVLGKYAQAYHFGNSTTSLTELVKRWQDYWPDIIPLPHPSPRNNIWLKKNAWFEREVLPKLRERVVKIIGS